MENEERATRKEGAKGKLGGSEQVLLYWTEHRMKIANIRSATTSRPGNQNIEALLNGSQRKLLLALQAQNSLFYSHHETPSSGAP